MLGNLFQKLFSATAARPFCTAVVPAAGTSSRMAGTDKLFADLCGMPVLARTLLALQSSTLVDEIVVVTRSESIVPIGEMCGEYNLYKVKKIVAGGENRSDSSLIGVMEASQKARLIAIHDGARPLVSTSVIDAAVRQAASHPAVAPAIPVSDTIKLAEGGLVTGTPERAKLFAVQTPQVFAADMIKGALTAASEKGLVLTDDCMAAEAIGVPVWLSAGSPENIKITNQTDLVVAEAILSARGENACE